MKYQIFWCFRQPQDPQFVFCQNQLGRSNLANFAKAEMALAVKPLIEARARGQQVRKPDNFVPLNSAEQIETNIEIARIASA